MAPKFAQKTRLLIQKNVAQKGKMGHISEPENEWQAAAAAVGRPYWEFKPLSEAFGHYFAYLILATPNETPQQNLD